MSKLKIDQSEIVHALKRDVDFEAYPQSVFLDSETGDILWVYDNDEDATESGISPENNRTDRERIESDPSRFIELEGRTHPEQHEILNGFLDSEWTDDEELSAEAQAAYRNSVGGWLRHVDENTRHVYEGFRHSQMVRIAEELLHRHGIEPIW